MGRRKRDISYAITSERDRLCVCVCTTACKYEWERFVTVMRNITLLWLDSKIHTYTYTYTCTQAHTDRLVCQHSVIRCSRLLPAHHFLCRPVTANQSTEVIWYWQDLTEETHTHPDTCTTTTQSKSSHTLLDTRVHSQLTLTNKNNVRNDLVKQTREQTYY